jgi:hypothetical protein
MEKFMKNEILQPVIETLQYKVNSTLGEFAKAFIERSDYETLGSIAKIGIDVNSFLDGLFLSFSSLEQLPLIEAELIIENDDEPEVVEVVTKDSPRVSNPKSVFSVSNEETKNWIFDYLGKRGGRALIADVCDEFYKAYSHLFTARELAIDSKNNSIWKKHVYRRVCDMRVSTDKKNKSHYLIVPTFGRRCDYYELSTYGARLYQQELKKVEEKKARYYPSDGMELDA